LEISQLLISDPPIVAIILPLLCLLWDAGKTEDIEKVIPKIPCK
jgi:hypothetical protein